MSAILINFEKKELLEKTAASLNLSVDDFINQLFENYLKEKERRFQKARVYVKKRYTKLYQRLA